MKHLKEFTEQALLKGRKLSEGQSCGGMAADFLFASVFEPEEGYYSPQRSGPAFAQITAPEGIRAVAAPCGAVR